MAEAIPKLATCNKRLRTCTGWTVLFMVLLRIGIGWHFFYEGAWKLMQDDWRATSYLVMAMGPLRPIFSGEVSLPVIGPMVKDANGVEQLTAAGTQARLDARFKQLVKYYGIRDKDLLDKLTKFKDARRGKAESDPAYQQTAASASNGLVASIIGDLKAARANPDVTSQPAAAIDDNAIKAATAASLAGNLAGFAPAKTDAPANAEAVAAVNAFLSDRGYQEKLEKAKAGFLGTLRDVRMGYAGSMFDEPDFAKQVEDYKTLLHEIKAFEHKLGTTGYNKERLLDQYARKARTKAACIVKAEKPMADMDIFVVGDVMTNRPGLLQRAFLEAKAAKQPNADEVQKQLAKGLPHYPSPTGWIDWANMLALTAIGVGLMLGLFTRLSALGGIGLLMMYYWCMPAFPWLPEAGPMEGHYLFVNKNLIEALALAMIATSRIGRWGGLDGILFRSRRLKAIAAAAQKQAPVDYAGGREVRSPARVGA